MGNCLGRTNILFQLRSMCVCFLTIPLFTAMSFQHLTQLSTLEDRPLSAVGDSYSIYSQLPSIFEAVPPFATRGRAMRWAGYVARTRIVERRIACRVLGRKPQGRRPLGDSGVGGSSGSGMLGHGSG